jgi:hypothetical protein
MRISSIMFLLIIAVMLVGTSVFAQPVLNPANGHYYEVVPKANGTTLTWSESVTQASALTHLGMPGYLVTITSDQERDFVNALDWHGEEYMWIGGSQLSGQAAPNIGWQWITGEPFLYDDWEPGEPNDDVITTGVEDNEENCLAFHKNSGWNDAVCSLAGGYFLVEFDPPAQTVPTMNEWGTIILIVVSGLGAVYYMRRQRRSES